MITQYQITDSETWTPITTAGQSGSCWLDDDNEESGDRADVRIWHKTGDAPGNAELTKAKRVLRPTNNSDLLILTADSATDIFYARCKNQGDTALLSVDVI